jgi:hypothetical protein
MKYYFTFLLSLAMAAQIRAQSFSYREDAEQLAARLMERNETIEELPADLIDSLEEILIAVANANHPKAEVITQKFNIHCRATADVHSFRFVTDSDYDWVKKIRKNTKQTPTVFQGLFDAFPTLSLSIIEAEADYTTFVFHSEKPMNMSFFAREVSMIAGVDMVMLGGNDQDKVQDTDIQLRRISGGWQVYYYFRNGSSHDEQYYWQFGVADSGEVRFLGEYGAAIPPNYTAQFQHTFQD